MSTFINRYIFHPYSVRHCAWDIAIAAILLTTFVATPFNFFDEIADWLAPFNLVIDVIFCIDCIKHFFTGL